MKKSLFKKISFATITAGAVVAPIVSVTSCSLFGNGGGASRSNYEFYNYQAYMNPDTIDKVKDTYTYTEFGELKEIEPGILENRVGAAIGSDYTNAMLAGKGLIGKLDFSKLYGITSDQTQWAKILGGYTDASNTQVSGIYTPATWKLLTSFKINKLKASTGQMVDANNNVVTDENNASHDIDGDGADDYLWEYMAPYFIQNKVVGVNLKRLGGAINNANNSMSQADFDALFKTKLEAKFGVGAKYTYKNILDTLRQDFGASKMTINDQYRDNMMIGSENTTDGTGFTGNFTSDSQYKNQISGFKNLLSNWNVTYDTSGVGNLENMILDAGDGAKIEAQAGLLYNGDALYAYNGGDESSSSKYLNDIRIINPENPTFLLDGLVVPTYVTNSYYESSRLYDVLSNYLYKGATFTYDKNNDIDSKNTVTGFTSGFISNNALYQNFDSVNYSSAFEQLDLYCQDNYFVDGQNITDENAKAIYNSTNDGVSKLDKNHITIPVNNKLANDSFNFYTSQK